jgi:hypothetical protein
LRLTQVSGQPDRNLYIFRQPRFAILPKLWQQGVEKEIAMQMVHDSLAKLHVRHREQAAFLDLRTGSVHRQLGGHHWRLNNHSRNTETDNQISQVIIKRTVPWLMEISDVIRIPDPNFRSQFLGSEFVNLFWLFPDNQMDERRTNRYEKPDS